MRACDVKKAIQRAKEMGYRIRDKIVGKLFIRYHQQGQFHRLIELSIPVEKAASPT